MSPQHDFIGNKPTATEFITGAVSPREEQCRHHLIPLTPAKERGNCCAPARAHPRNGHCSPAWATAVLMASPVFWKGYPAASRDGAAGSSHSCSGTGFNSDQKSHSPIPLPRQVSLGRKMDGVKTHLSQNGAESFTETKGYRNIMLKKKLNPSGPKKRKLVISLHIWKRRERAKEVDRQVSHHHMYSGYHAPTGDAQSQPCTLKSTLGHQTAPPPSPGTPLHCPYQSTLPFQMRERFLSFSGRDEQPQFSAQSQHKSLLMLLYNKTFPTQPDISWPNTSVSQKEKRQVLSKIKKEMPR